MSVISETVRFVCLATVSNDGTDFFFDIFSAQNDHIAISHLMNTDIFRFRHNLSYSEAVNQGFRSAFSPRCYK